MKLREWIETRGFFTCAGLAIGTTISLFVGMWWWPSNTLHHGINGGIALALACIALYLAIRYGHRLNWGDEYEPALEERREEDSLFWVVLCQVTPTREQPILFLVGRCLMTMRANVVFICEGNHGLRIGCRDADMLGDIPYFEKDPDQQQHMDPNEIARIRRGPETFLCYFAPTQAAAQEYAARGCPI